MAYIAYEFNSDGKRATFWSYLQIALINFGWELHDSVSATVKVYKSNGESGNEPYGYVWIDAGTSTYIEYRAYQYWDNVAHAGVRLRYAGDNVSNSRMTSSFFSVSAPVLMCGDKNLVVIVAQINISNTANNAMIFGHIPARFSNAMVHAHGTAGTAGTITIAESSYLGNGKNIQIVGSVGEGCDSLSIVSAPDSTTRLLLKLPRNYGTGAIVGAPASVFGITHGYTPSFFPVSLWGDSGTTVGTGVLTVTGQSNPALGSYRFYNEKMYYAVPLFIWNQSAASPGQALGFLGNNILNIPSYTSMSASISNNDGSFCEISSVDFVEDTTLTDSKKSWTINQHAGRFCIIVEGVGAGAIKRILSNTATTLTLDSSWHSDYYPSVFSTYRIADTVYRSIVGLFQSANCGLKITRTDAPA
jgi:hypothetical protein